MNLQARLIPAILMRFWMCSRSCIVMVKALSLTHDKKSALRGNRIIYLKDGQIFGECDLEDFPAGDEKRKDKLD